MRKFSLIFAILLQLNVARFVSAASGEAQISFDVGVGTPLPSENVVLAGNIAGWLGMNDWFWLSGAIGTNGLTKASSTMQMVFGSAFAFDALSYMPWAQLMLGVSSEFPVDLRPLVRADVGADRWLNFNWAIGGWARAQVDWPNRAGVVQVLAGVRCTWRWGL
ncbi:MAG: hypothetical protein KTR25_05585 [Myxococcales bacterium]|nr:hypothetical protein [Myxococcales bacterium]